MGTSVRRGTMMIASVLAAAGAARAQEMQMPKQEQHHQMEMPPVKPEYPRMGRAQENAKGALVTVEVFVCALVVATLESRIPPAKKATGNREGSFMCVVSAAPTPPYDRFVGKCQTN